MICTFNGIRFDFPFLAAYLALPEKTVSPWIAKTFDIWESSKCLLRETFPMHDLLRVNNIASKSASGLQAIEWAKDPSKWDDLEQYCLQDVRVTLQVSMLPSIILPIGAYGWRTENADIPEDATSRNVYSIRKTKTNSVYIHVESKDLKSDDP